MSRRTRRRIHGRAIKARRRSSENRSGNDDQDSIGSDDEGASSSVSISNDQGHDEEIEEETEVLDLKGKGKAVISESENDTWESGSSELSDTDRCFPFGPDHEDAGALPPLRIGEFVKGEEGNIETEGMNHNKGKGKAVISESGFGSSELSDTRRYFLYGPGREAVATLLSLRIGEGVGGEREHKETEGLDYNKGNGNDVIEISEIERDADGVQVMGGKDEEVGEENFIKIHTDNLDLARLLSKRSKGRGELWIDYIEDEDIKHLKEEDKMVKTAEASPDFLMPLLMYQKEWLAWALKQEESMKRGGILADETGMGKTIQAIALVLTARAKLQTEFGSTGPSSHSPSPSMELPPIKATLVICPLAAITQWKKEIAKSTSEGSTKMLVFYKSNRRKDIYQFSDYDFILTTYSTIEAEYQNFIDDNNKIDKGSPTRKSVMHSLKWNRIILDEAHLINDPRTQRAKAVHALDSSYKWALTGTPVQNHIGELYSLVRFLQINPYAFFFCKKCECKSLDRCHSSQCTSCLDPSNVHFGWWKKFVARPLQSIRKVNDKIESTAFLKEILLKSIMLKRTKEERAVDVALPSRVVTVNKHALDKNEEDIYKSLRSASQIEFKTYLEAESVMTNYNNLYTTLTQLRQAVNHPYLVTYSNDGIRKCGACYESAENPVVTSCRHVFCEDCLKNYHEEIEPNICPSCLNSLTEDDIKTMVVPALPDDQHSRPNIEGFAPSSIINKINLNEFQTSTKIEALREEITFMIERDGSAKGVVFSQFTSFLDLIRYSLQESGVGCVQLEGSMTLAARDAALDKFADDPDCRILLMILKTGRVALDLTAASHVFLMEPSWNPAFERRAKDQIHRIGQYKPVRVVKFIAEDTIDEKLLEIQNKKDVAFYGTIGDPIAILERLNEEEWSILFQ